MKNNESILDFTRRVNFNIKNKLYTQSISKPMGRGIKVITLTDATLSQTVKIEVDMDKVDDIVKEYPHLSTTKTQVKQPARTDGLDDIGDLYK